MGTQTFGYTGAWQTFNVPTGVSSINVDVYGASSGSRLGGRVSGNIAVSDTDTLYIVCGGVGGAGANGNVHSQPGGNGGWGAGGDGGAGYNDGGGNGGGGYSAIRRNGTTGQILCVAGGAGGNSADGGTGGLGGGGTGYTGGRGNAGSGAATGGGGGGPSNGGAAGTSSSGSTFYGNAGSSVTLGAGGTGGDTGGLDGPGGGGGGGGYHSGGGGAAGSTGYAPGTGGGGGSSALGILSSPASYTGVRSGSGAVVLTWTDPDVPPAVPVITQPASSGLHTLATSFYNVHANLPSPPAGSTSVRLLVRYSTSSSFSSYTDLYSSYRSTAGDAYQTISGIATNTRYYLRCYSQGNSGLYSTSYDTANFYTDYSPDVPTITAPPTSTLATSTVNAAATVSDFDGGTVRALFRYSTDGFATYTDVYSGYVNSGSSATATLTGLSVNTQYSLQVYAQDPQGLFSATPASTTFWTNRTPTVATLVQPANNAVLDSTIAQTFDWTFNDPDSGDSQSAATLQYRPVGGSTWTQVSVTTATQYTFAANTFTPNQQYEWQIQTTDAGGLVSDWSPSSLVTLSPPVVNMSSSAALTLNAVDTISVSAPLSAHAAMVVTPTLIKTPVVPMGASAQVSIQGKDTITRSLAAAAVASMTINSGPIQVMGIVPMSATSGLTIGGVDTIQSLLTMSASAKLTFQQASGENLMSVRAGLTIAPSPILKQSTLAFGGTSSLQLGVERTIPGTLAIGALAAMSVGSLVQHSQVVQMSAQASVINSAGVSRSIPTLMVARGSMTVTGGLSRSLVSAMHASAGLTIHGFNNVIVNGLKFRAQGGMSISGKETIDSGGLPIQAQAGMSIIPIVAVVRTVPITVQAGMFTTQPQYVYKGPYLVTTDSRGDTISFTLNSYPIPRTVTHRINVTDTGNVTP